MINESKQAIKQVFDNFDKDKSGFIDSSELIAIAKELNTELKQEEVDKLLNVVDINKDGKISFQEFWDWWQFGKTGKLERLVFLKLQTMNLIKKVHSEFTRHGQSLMQKYEQSKRDHHYFAINYGESFGHIRLKTNVLINGKGIQEEIKDLSNKYGIIEQTYIQLFLVIKCQNPEVAKPHFDALLKKTIEAAMKTKGALLEVFGPDSGIDITFQTGEMELIMNVKIAHPLVLDTLDQQYVPSMNVLGENNYFSGELNIGIKNGLKKLIAKNLPFVKYLFEGFIFEANLIQNSSLANSIFKVLQSMTAQSLGQKSSQKSYFNKMIALPLLLKSSKFHLTFKNMDDVNALFKSLGLDDMVQGQPTGRDLIYDVFRLDDIMEFKRQDVEYHFVYEFIKLCQQQLVGQGSIHILLPNTLITTNFNIDGLSECVDCILRDDKEGLELTQKREKQTIPQ